jgi:hypothetical protein
MQFSGGLPHNCFIQASQYCRFYKPAVECEVESITPPSVAVAIDVVMRVVSEW